MPHGVVWLIAIISTFVCLFLWFRDVRRIMRERRSMVDSAASQLAAFREKASDASAAPATAAILERSEGIYRQAVDLYHQTLKTYWCRFPAALMGFRPIPLQVPSEPPPAKEPPQQTFSEEPVEQSPALPQKEPYFGSVRFFKNLILLTVIILIAIPTGLTIHFSKNLDQTEQQLQVEANRANQLHEENDSLRNSLQQTQNALQQQIESSPWKNFQCQSPYADLYPDFYAPQALTEGIREEGVIYLTFDDGPSARTAEVLDILKEKDVKATFFVVGSSNESGTQLLRRIIEEGHTLAMHSYSHNYNKIYASVEDYLADMYQIFTQIKETTGVTPTLFRFPGGSINGYNRGIYQELISEMLRRGFVPYDWNVSSADAASSQPTPVNDLINNVITGAARVQCGIVLMHDSAAKTTTVQALPLMIDRLREMGFELKALSPEVMPILYTYRE